MKQILTRVSDEQHATLKRRAAREGRSMNDLVVAALDRAALEDSDPRERLRARAAALGILAEPMGPPPTGPIPSYEEILEENRGSGPALSEALEWTRGPKP